MHTRLYQIYDKNAENVVGPIMVFPKEGPAIRAFNETCAQKDSMVNKYPHEYELRCIGEQNTDTGEITPIMFTVATGTQWAESQGEPPLQLKQA